MNMQIWRDFSLYFDKGETFEEVLGERGVNGADIPACAVLSETRTHPLHRVARDQDQTSWLNEPDFFKQRDNVCSNTQKERA